MSRAHMYRYTTAHPNLVVPCPKSQKKVVHFNDNANKEFIIPARDVAGAEEDSDYEIDRAFERSLESGHMTEAELIEEAMRMCGWYEGTPEVMPPMSNAHSLSDDTSGVFTWDDLDSSPSSSNFSSKSRLSRKLSTRQPSVSSIFSDLHVSAGNPPYHPYKRIQKKKSTFVRTDSVSDAPKNSPKWTDFDDELEDAFHGIVREDNNTVTVIAKSKTTEVVMEQDSSEESPSDNFWDDVEF